MWPIANAIVSTVSPNASETPSSPMPTFGNAAASTALPQPPRTSQKVPTNSATGFFTVFSSDLRGGRRLEVQRSRAHHAGLRCRACARLSRHGTALSPVGRYGPDGFLRALLRQRHARAAQILGHVPE